ncbi:MAG: potassium-transporting ATPase subunit KdpA, partial [Burkholderiaceae bacterium]|nr:potassium-transporting ATPase subunit KdpA [Burkholderiaceae bacterium]
MSMQALLLLLAFLAVLLALAYPLGIYLAKVAEPQSIRGLAWLHKFEAVLYRAAGVKEAEQGWKSYAIALIAFNTVGAVSVYFLQRIQSWLPLNPQNLPNIGADSSFNTAISFVTNTNWQSYTPESTM